MDNGPASEIFTILFVIAVVLLVIAGEAARMSNNAQQPCSQAPDARGFEIRGKNDV
jgi:hypothetical protein